MKINNTIYLLLLLILTVFTSCQKYKTRRANAFNNIEMLRNNVLLVRLKSADKKIAALEKVNNSKAISETKRQLSEQNQSIRNAFKGNFKFCDTYFFYANEAKFLRKKQYDQITLYDNNNKKIKDQSCLEKGYLTAALDYIHEYEFINETDNVRKVASATMGIPSLVLLDKDFVPLSKPFPRRVINRSGDSLDADEVTQLDLQLFQYYKKHQNFKARKTRKIIDEKSK